VKALDAFTMVRPSPVSRLLAARDMVYAHFQLQMEGKSIMKREEARKLKAKQAKSGNKGRVKVSEKEATISTKNMKEKERDLELQRSDGPEELLYVVSESKAPFFNFYRKMKNFFGRMKQTFSDARSRRALVCASTAMISQQLTGINTIGRY
jgi:hypothetical protein